MNSIEQIASAIHNHIAAGLKGSANEPYSIQQLEDEIYVARNAIMQEYYNKGVLPEATLIQSINCLELDCENMSLCCNVDTYDKALHFKIPKLMTYIQEPIKYIGTTDRKTSFRVYRGTNPMNAFRFRKYGKNKPYVWISSNGVDGFLFNPPTENIKYISIDAVFENPKDLEEFACCPEDIGDDAATIPNWMVDKIIDHLTNRFTKNYFKLNYKQNDGKGH